MPDNKLTHKQEKFCQEYIIDFNAKQAAIRAGYSVRTAKVIGCENLTKPNLATRIKELQEGLKQKAIESGEIADPEEVLKGYTRDIRFNPKRLYDEKGELIPVHKLDDEIALSVAGCRLDAHDNLEYKYPDKTRVRDSLAKMLGMIPTGNGKNGDDGDTNIENLQINIYTEPVDKALEFIK